MNPVIRIKSDTVLRQRTKRAPAWVWFNTFEQGEVKELGKARVMGIRVFAIGTLISEGEYLLLVTLKRPSRALLRACCTKVVHLCSEAIRSQHVQHVLVSTRVTRDWLTKAVNHSEICPIETHDSSRCV